MKYLNVTEGNIFKPGHTQTTGNLTTFPQVCLSCYTNKREAILTSTCWVFLMTVMDCVPCVGPDFLTVSMKSHFKHAITVITKTSGALLDVGNP